MVYLNFYLNSSYLTEYLSKAFLFLFYIISVNTKHDNPVIHEVQKVRCLLEQCHLFKLNRSWAN